MRHIIITSLLAVICLSTASAQNTDGSKLLVFRNTGEINIFDSDSITKVELSVFDADSIQHDNFVTQVFHHNNASYSVIPLEEIDSVVFGYRGIIEPKKNVRRLSDDEAAAISSFDGETIIYDSRLNLTSGETVYYDCITDIMPMGLCVKINKIHNEANNYKAEVSWLDTSDVFERYLITGDAILNTDSSMKKAHDYDRKPFEFGLPEINKDGARIEGKFQVNFDAEATDIVIDAKNKYYHAAVKIFAYPHTEFSVLTSGKQEVHHDFPKEGKPHFGFPALAHTINFNFTFDAFLDILAEAGLQYEFGQEYAMSFEWTSKDDEDYFSKPIITPTDPATATQKLEVHLNGEVFAGVRADLNICTVFRLAGAGIELKFGPRIKSELSLGAIQELSERFDQEVYAKSNVQFQLGLKTETYYFHRVLLAPWLINKVKLPFESEIFADLFTYNIFPEFNSKAVLARETAPVVQTEKEPEAVSISTFVEEELLYPLDISFEIADKITDKTLAETEVIDTIEKDKVDYQTIYTDITIPDSLGKIDKDMVVARPVISYKGYKVKARPSNVAGDMILTPNICTMTGNSSYFVSGMTPVSQHNYGDYTYIEGNLLGNIGNVDPRYKKRIAKTCEFIDLSDLGNYSGQSSYTHPLIGNWHGTIANENVAFTFVDNINGKYNDIPFTYCYNSPYKGGIAIKLENGGTISFSIVNITDDSLILIMKGSEKETVLTRQ